MADTEVSDDRFYIGPDDEPDRYEIIEMIRSGGEGTVSKARFLLDGTWQLVAVKTLLPDRVGDIDQWIERWRGQVALLRLLQDPGVVGVHDGFAGPVAHRAGQSPGRPRTLHLVMNWVEGPALIEWRDHNTGPSAFHSAAKVLGQVGAALDYLASGRDTNGQPVVHGDLKPANVIVTPAGQSRLVDFGLARLAHSRSSAPLGGTPGYTAPEVQASGQFSPASDRYALGAVAYFLMVGEDPPEHYDADTMRAKLAAAPLLQGRPGVGEHILEMLSTDPALRPMSAAAWARQFGLSSTTIDPPTGATGAAAVGRPTPPEGPRSRRKWLVGAAILVVLLVVGGAALALGGGDDDGGGSGGGGGESAATTLAPTTTPTHPATTTTTTRPVTTTTTRPTTTTTTTAGSKSGISGITHLADMDVLPDHSYSEFKEGTANVAGTTYTRSIMIDPYGTRPGYVEYDLSKKAKSLEGIVGPADDVRADSVYKVQVYGDGNPLFDQTVRLGDATPINVDLTGVLRLRLQVTDLSTSASSGRAYVVFGDTRIIPA